MKSIGYFMQKYGIVCILLFFIISKLFLMFKFHEYFWDESVYMAMGKYLFSFGNVGLWESIRPPLLPIMLGAIWKSGLGAALFSEFLIVLFSCGVLVITYIIAAKIFDWKVGLLSTLLLALTPVFFKFSSLVMTGLPSTFFALLAIYFYISDKDISWAGVFACLAFLTRYPQGLIIAALGLTIILSTPRFHESWSKLVSFSSGALAVFAPFAAFNYFMYRETAGSMIDAVFMPLILAFRHQGNVFESINGQLYNSFYYFIMLFRENYLFVFALLGIGIALWAKKYRSRVFPLIIPLALYLIYFSIIINKQARFSLVFLPLVSIFAGFGLVYCYNHAQSMGRWQKYTAFAVLALAVCATGYSMAAEDWKIYHFRASAPPEIVTDFYSGYIDGLDEPILISDPTSAAYIDKQMIGFYQDNVEGPQVYDEYKDKAGSIIFHKQVYPCVEGDADCNRINEEFFKRLNSENKLVDVREYYGVEYYVFS